MSKDSTIAAADYYKSWTAYDALQKAARATNYRSVWRVLSCTCCQEPSSWQHLPILPLPRSLHARVRWYDQARLPETSADATTELGASEVQALQGHFVGHHQRIELVLLCLQPSLDYIYAALKPFQDKMLDELPEDVMTSVLRESENVSNGWSAVGQLVRGVAKMDRIKYLAYVPRLAGVSGGNSPTMLPSTQQTVQLESLFTAYTDSELAHAIKTNSPAGRLAEAFIDCLDSLSRCWFDHVVTATTAIGITQGTKGTPNIVLVDRVLRPLHGSRLLMVLGSLRSPITGIGTEMRQLHDYETYPLADHYLDMFMDPGPEFGTHSVGWLPVEFELAREEFLGIRRAKRTSIWEHFYSETRPAFLRELSSLIGIDSNGSETVGFGLGSSVTEVLARLTASLSMMVSPGPSVVIPDNEFVTIQRAAAILGLSGASVTRVPWDRVEEQVARPRATLDQDEKKDQEPMIEQLIMVSLVNSCTQQIQQLDWVEDLPHDVVVVVDITQAIANIPLACLGQLAARPNVFLVGSLIKHARCGENLGFMTFSRGSDRLIKEPASGWTAYLSGLVENKTTASNSNHLLYDEGLEWEGGTPSWVEATFVATRILKSMPPVEEQHAYVRKLKAAFVKRAGPMLSKVQLDSISDSNTLALPVSKVVDLPFGLDYKIVNGVTYLRIGFGIHNLDYHLDALVGVLKSTGALS